MKQAVARNELVKSKPAGDYRAKMIRYIQTNFPKLRPDLRHSTEELREARLQFCSEVLKLRAPLTSIKRLNEHQLGRVIDAMKREMKEPLLPGSNVIPMPTAKVADQQGLSCKAKDMGGSTVIHLAGNEQVWAIERVLDHLNWSEKGREAFFQRNWQVNTPRQLQHVEANAAFAIVMTIACSNEIKAQKGDTFKVSREMIRQHTPGLKRRLGIGSKKSE